MGLGFVLFFWFFIFPLAGSVPQSSSDVGTESDWPADEGMVSQ